MIVDNNIDPLTVAETSTVRETLARLNATPHLVQVVVDGERRVVGIATDGDIRRGLVQGVGLDSPIRDCMHRKPIVAREVSAAIAMLDTISGRHRCVPVLDARDRLVCMVSDSPETPGLHTAVIMAGGFGSRLGERTRATPKPMLSVGGKPILWHLVRNLEEQGVQRVFVTVHYLGDQIRSYCAGAGFRAAIDVLTETQPMGTAGGLSLLPRNVDGPILVLNGDILTRADYGAMMVHHQTSGRDATVGAARYEIDVPFGVLDLDDHGDIVGIREKPRYSNFIAAGLYVLEPSIYRLAQPAVRLDMPELLRSAVQQNKRVGLFPIHEYWLDVGRPDDLGRAELDVHQWHPK